MLLLCSKSKEQYYFALAFWRKRMPNRQQTLPKRIKSVKIRISDDLAEQVYRSDIDHGVAPDEIQDRLYKRKNRKDTGDVQKCPEAFDRPKVNAKGIADPCCQK
jgi:hypothetical protein